MRPETSPTFTPQTNGNDSLFLERMEAMAFKENALYKDIPRSDERRLVRLFQEDSHAEDGAGERAISTLLYLHKGLIKRVAKDESNKASRRDLDLEHIILSGANGFVSAVHKWKPAKSNDGRLATYAHYHIRAEAQYEIALQRGITKWELESLGRLRYATALLIRNNARHKPTDQEIAEELGWKETTVRALRGKAERTVRLIPVDEKIKTDAVSVEKNRSLSYGTFHSVEDEIIAREEQDHFHTTLDSLNPEEAKVLQRLFGIGNHDAHNLTKISRNAGLTAYEAKKLKNTALTNFASVFTEAEDLTV